VTDTLGPVLILGEPGEECATISRLVAPGAATRRTSFPSPSEDVPWTAVVLVAPCCRSPLVRKGGLPADGQGPRDSRSPHVLGMP